MKTLNKEVHFLFLSLLLAFAIFFRSQVYWMTEMALQFFNMINYHQYRHHGGREFILLLQLPGHLLMKMTQNRDLLRVLYPLPYFLIPISSLALSWQLLRKTLPQLFVWPCLSILLGHIYSQHQMTSEHIMVVQFSWPYLLGLMTLKDEKKIIWLVCGGFLLFFTHPISILSFMLAALILYKQEKGHPGRQQFLVQALFLIACIRFLLLATNEYDHLQISPYSPLLQDGHLGRLFSYFQMNHYLPAIHLALFYFLGILILFKYHHLNFLGPLLISVLIWTYAHPITHWIDGLASWSLYFRFSFFISLPIFLMAIFDYFFSTSRPIQAQENTPVRMRFLPWIGLAHLACMTIFAWNFQRIDQALTTEIQTPQTEKCVDMSELKSLPRIFKNYMIIPIYILLKLDRRPKAVFAYKRDCIHLSRYGQTNFFDYYASPYPWEKTSPDYYYDFSLLR